MAKRKKNIKTVGLRGTASDEVSDHSNDPFVLKKVEAAKKAARTYRVTNELLK